MFQPLARNDADGQSACERLFALTTLSSLQRFDFVEVAARPSELPVLFEFHYP